MCCLRVMHLADENRAVVTSLVLVDFLAGLESSLRLLLASRGTRQGQHYRLLVISSNQRNLLACSQEFQSNLLCYCVGNFSCSVQCCGWCCGHPAFLENTDGVSP